MDNLEDAGSIPEPPIMENRKIIYIDVAHLSARQAELLIEEIRDNLRAGLKIEGLEEKYSLEEKNWLGFWCMVVAIVGIIYFVVTSW